MITEERNDRLTFRFLAEPADINFGGKVHGGAVMKWIDSSSFACASQWSGKYCVTAYVGGIRFIRPILIGQIVEVNSRIIYTGNTSMHIAVDVFASDPKMADRKRTTHCIIVFVALDEDGRPTEIPMWQPQSPEEENLHRYALSLMDKRNEIEREMQPYYRE